MPLLLFLPLYIPRKGGIADSCVMNIRADSLSLFLDYRADPRFSSFNTLIYGHRMRNETMFGCLKHYKDAAFWQEYPSVKAPPWNC